MNETVENSVGHRRIAEVIVPVLDRQLTGDQGRVPVVALFEDFEQIAAAGGGHGAEPPVVEDQQVGLGNLGHQLRVAAVGTGEGKLLQQAWQSLIEGRVAEPAGLVGQGAGEVALADAGGTGDEDIVSLGEVAAAGQGQHEVAIEPAGGFPVKILNAGALAQVGAAQTGAQAAAVAFGLFAIDHQAKTLLEAQRVGGLAETLFLESLKHAGQLEGTQFVFGGVAEHAYSGESGPVVPI